MRKTDPRRIFLSALAIMTLLLSAHAPSALARNVYVANLGSGSVSLLDSPASQIVGPPIATGGQPREIAITPDGQLRLRRQHRHEQRSR